MGVLNMGMGILWNTYVSPEKPSTMGRTVCDKPPNVMLEIKKNSKWLINSTCENVRRPQVRLFPASSSSGTCSKPRCGRLGMVPGSNRPTAPSLRSRPLKSLGQWSGGQIRNCFGAQAWYLCDISWTSFGWPLHRSFLFLTRVHLHPGCLLHGQSWIPCKQKLRWRVDFPMSNSSQQTRARHLPNQGSLDHGKKHEKSTEPHGHPWPMSSSSTGTTSRPSAQSRRCRTRCMNLPGRFHPWRITLWKSKITVQTQHKSMNKPTIDECDRRNMKQQYHIPKREEGYPPVAIRAWRWSNPGKVPKSQTADGHGSQGR